MDYSAARQQAVRASAARAGRRAQRADARPCPTDTSSRSRPQPGQGRISRYAWGDGDYHDVIHDRLKRLIRLAEGPSSRGPGSRRRRYGPAPGTRIRPTCRPRLDRQAHAADQQAGRKLFLSGRPAHRSGTGLRRALHRRPLRHVPGVSRRLPDAGLSAAVCARRDALHQLPDDRAAGVDSRRTCGRASATGCLAATCARTFVRGIRRTCRPTDLARHRTLPTRWDGPRLRPAADSQSRRSRRPVRSRRRGVSATVSPHAALAGQAPRHPAERGHRARQSAGGCCRRCSAPRPSDAEPIVREACQWALERSEDGEGETWEGEAPAEP